MGFLTGTDPHYDVKGGYAKDELEKIFGDLGAPPGFTPPNTGYLKDLDQHVAWQTGMRKQDLGRYKELYNQEPFKNEALGYAQQTLGGAPQNISDYFAKRGISPAGNINRDTGTEAGRMHSEAQRKIMSKAKQLQLATIEKMLGHVGDPSAGMAGIASAGLASDSQASQVLAQGWANAMNQFQMENPAPQLQYDPGSPGLLGMAMPILGSLAGNALLPGLGGLLGGGSLSALFGGAGSGNGLTNFSGSWG